MCTATTISSSTTTSTTTNSTTTASTTTSLKTTATPTISITSIISTTSTASITSTTSTTSTTATPSTASTTSTTSTTVTTLTTSMTSQIVNSRSPNNLSLTLGLGLGLGLLLLLILSILATYLFCRCCPGYLWGKLRQRYWKDVQTECDGYRKQFSNQVSNSSNGTSDGDIENYRRQYINKKPQERKADSSNEHPFQSNSFSSFNTPSLVATRPTLMSSSSINIISNESIPTEWIHSIQLSATESKGSMFVQAFHGKIFLKMNVKERVFEKIERILSTTNVFRRVSQNFERVPTRTCW
ncbi:unnamed protein product [Rotaria magnacalcarata]